MVKKKKAGGDQLEEKVKDLENKWKRALADYRNLEKRVEKERVSLVKFLSVGLIDKLLGVLDDLERAEEHLRDRGLTLAVNQFKQVLRTEGVEEIKAQGEEFNPETMDCSEITEGPKNKVVSVIEKGYRIEKKVIRPAKVKVGGGKKKDV